MTSRDISGYTSLFLKTAKEHIASLENMLKSQGKPVDWDDFFRHVHSLKGSSQMMGFGNISEVCSEIINNIRPQDSIVEVDGELTQILKLLVEKLKKQLRTLESEKTGDVLA